MHRKLMILFVVTASLFVQSAVATNWKQTFQENRTFNEVALGYNTVPFNVSGSEWRIDWSYVPLHQTAGSTSSSFGVTVFAEGKSVNSVPTYPVIFEMGSNQTSGTSYVHQGRGEYYLTISVVNLQSCAITVWYDVDSVSTQGIDTTLLVVSVLIIVALVAAVIAMFKRRRK